MDASCTNFVQSLLDVAVELEASNRAMRDEWMPEEPPVTTLFAEFGYQIAESFDTAPPERRNAIFQLVESAMSSNDTALVTAVATGLIEAMVSRATQIDGLWPRLSTLLGSNSLRHAQVWLGA